MMKRSLLLFCLLAAETYCQLLLVKKDIEVPIGREVYLRPSDLQFHNITDDAVCKVEVITNEPITQRVGILEPHVFDCAFKYGTVKYSHHGLPLLTNDTVKLRAYKFLKQDTILEYFEILFLIRNISYEVIQPLQPLVIKDFFGTTEPIDENILRFNFSRKEGAVCKVRMSRHINNRPAHGQIIIGREKRSIDVIKRRCDDFLHLGLRYEHLKPPSPDIDFVLIIVEVSDPYLNNGDLMTEWYHIPIQIEPGFPNLPPKASFSGMYLMDVDQFIITAITPAVLSATDSETPSEQLVFNMSRPLLPHQGSIVHLSDHTRPISSFMQSDLNSFDIAYKPPSRSFKDRQMFEIEFIIFDPDFAWSEPFTMHIAIRPAITNAPRVSMNSGMVLLEGQSRPLRISNLEIVDSDNVNDIQIFVTGGLHHGKLEVDKKPAVTFMQKDIIQGSVMYHHDDSDTTKDSIHFRIFDGSHSTHVKFPITIIPKDDKPPSLVINVGLKVNEGSNVQITPTSLRAVDHDTTDDNVNFIVTKFPESGNIWKKYIWEKAGKDITTFTQRDVNKGLVYYHHNGNEVFTDVFEVFLQDANNPPNISPPYKILIRIMPVGDDPPKRDPASSFSIEVRESALGILSSAHLRYMDIDSLDSEIIYNITTAPRFIGSFAHTDRGKLVLVSDEILLKPGEQLTAIKNFTQEQVNHHKIAYAPPTSEIGPNPLYLQFIFIVKDKDNNSVSGQTFNITILPVNNQVPQLHTGELLVEEGLSTLLSTNELSVYDPDTLTSDLQMSLFTVPLHGSLQRSKQPLRVGDLLSLDDILTLRLEYVHDGSESFRDGFKVGVNDGIHFVSGEVLVEVEPVDDEKPVWKKNLKPRITVNEGKSVKLTPQVLAASDVDTDDNALYFILTEVPLLGSIVVDKRNVNRFTQKDLINGGVSYVHNGLEIGANPKEDSLTLIVTDKAVPRMMSHNSRKIFVTILPQNTRPPRLYFKRAILVDEGQRMAITEDNLLATDDDTFPAELLIVISKQPEFGYLENLRPTPGYEKSGRGERIGAFPLQDVKNGFISFVQFDHKNIEPESDSFEVFVTDGVHNSTSIVVYVSIVLLNDEVPQFYLANITIEEGGAFTMDNNSIQTSDRDFPGDILVITVKTKPKHGTLTHFVQAVNNGPMIEIPFTESAAETLDSIIYHHDGSENLNDAFTLSLTDGQHNILRTCFVDVVPVNDEPPILFKNVAARNVEMQGNIVLSSAFLLAEDVDSSPQEVMYVILGLPKYGVLEKKRSNWVAMDPLMFSQDDVNFNRVRYKQTVDIPTSLEDGFSFRLTDGIHNSTSAMFTIKIVDPGKTSFGVTVNGGFVEYGNEMKINSSMLYAEDNSSQLEDIIFHVTKEPLYGTLLLNNNTSSVHNFTLFHILNKQLSYRHNESAKTSSDSFNLMATNGVIMKNATFIITIVHDLVNKVPVLEAVLPLSIDMNDPRSEVITSQHLLAYQPSTPDDEILFQIVDQPKFGSLMYNKKISRLRSFTQSDVNKELISYHTELVNVSATDQFTFKVTNNKEEGYLLDGNLLSNPTVFQISIKPRSQTSEPILIITPPKDLENVWNGHVGFQISGNNLKASFRDTPPRDIKFYVVRYLQHGYIFHRKEETVIRTFTQEDIDEQRVIIILKHGAETYDYFTFHVSADQVTYNKEHRMDLYWAVVFFPRPEYSVCEDAATLNIVVKRVGNLDISSYVSIMALEQTAKEGLDFVSRRANKIQFDPGVAESAWQVVIVKDDLEEAPIEQLQVVLSEPENCIVTNHTRTIVSIYDLNRGSCSQIPVINLLNAKEDSGPRGTNEDSDEVFLDRVDDDEPNNSEFPMMCTQNIYGLLHYKQSTQSLFQCNGRTWVPWQPETSLNPSDNEPTLTFNFKEKGNPNRANEVTSDNGLNSGIFDDHLRPPVGSVDLENHACLKGWQEFGGMCHKWHRQQSAWASAQETCRGYPSGHLVVIRSPSHNNWLVELARTRPFWIGLYVAPGRNNWGYASTQHVPFLNWRKNFPRLAPTGEIKNRCVLVRGSGSWINRNCEMHEHSFICSMPVLNTT